MSEKKDFFSDQSVYDDEAIIKRTILAINLEIHRLEKLKNDRKKLLAKIRIIIRSCALMAGADGKTTREEIYKMHNEIFKKYFITEEAINKYLIFSLEDISLSTIKKDIDEFDINKEFLKDLYNQLKELKDVDGESSQGEEDILFKLYNIFKLR